MSEYVEEEVTVSMPDFLNEPIADFATLRGVQAMPLFKESRHKWYPRMIYHTSTKNESFLKESARLKAAGIKNYDWMLVLLQPELEHVDPRDTENLTPDICAKIWLECKFNPSYFFREILQLKASTQSGWTPFLSSRLNLSQIFLYFCGVAGFYVAPRQQGKTTGIYCIDWYLMLFWLKNSKINLLTISIKNGLDAIGLMKQARESTPEYLFQSSYADGTGREKIRIDTRNNEWGFIVHASSVLDADMKGRGLTSPNPRVDEVAYIKHLEKTLMSALPGSVTAMAQAEEDGLPNGLMWASTAGELDTESGAYAYSIVHKCYTFTEALYDLPSRSVVKQVVDLGSERSMVYAEFSYLQLGKTKDWLEQKRKTDGYNRLTLEKDFLNIWVRGSSASLVSPEHRTKIGNSEVLPKHTEIDNDLLTYRWYIPEDEIDTYLRDTCNILTMDSSDGVGGDGNGIYLMNTNTTETLMAAGLNSANLITIGYQIANLLIKHRHILFNIEAKSSARALIDIIVLRLVAAGEDPFKRIYNSVVSDPESHPKLHAQYRLPMGRRDKDVYTIAKKHFGFMTTANSRALLYGAVLSTALKNSSSLLKDKQLCGELLSITIKNGRIDHSNSGHDDLVIAWLIAHWTIIFGRNLDEYGIRTDQLMQRISEQGGVATEEELRKRSKANLLRTEIEEVKSKLKTEVNPFLEHKLQSKLKSLINKYGDYGDDPLSFTEIVTDIQEAKMMKRSKPKSIIF